MSGNVNLREVNVAFRGSDRIASLLVDEGAVVSQGQILGYLHSDELNLTVQQAKATIVAQEAIVAKLQAGSRPEEIAQASARVTSAEAALAQSKQEAEKLQKSSASIQFSCRRAKTGRYSTGPSPIGCDEKRTGPSGVLVEPICINVPDRRCYNGPIITGR